MILAFLNGLIGLGLTLALGVSSLNLSVLSCLGCFASSNLAALLSLLATLQAQKSPLLKRAIAGTLNTWAFLVFIYLGILVATAPVLRDWKTLTTLLIPLVFSTGFGILVFGPIQDQIVRRQQRRLRLEAQRRSQSKNDFPCFPTDSAVL